MSNHSRIRLTAAAAAVIGALTVTACSSGDSVVDKPKAKASAKAGSGQQAAKKPAAKASAAPEVAKPGDKYPP
ncbi:hypothetical protein [Streptomyces afghaniensis 772] [Streptomyces afghaniensis]